MKDFIRTMVKLGFLSRKGKGLPFTYEEGAPKLVLVTGENAQGKSFFLKYFHAYQKNHDTECLHISMKYRTEGMHRAFMYVGEDSFSTGHNSVVAVIGCIETSKKREHEHYLVLDEPSIGLSDSYQIAMGRYLADFAGNMPDNAKGMMIATHSRYFARQLLPLKPTHVRIGDRKTLDDWLNSEPEEKTADDLLALPIQGKERFGLISDISRKLREK